jgi:hypothetical protein
MSLSLSIALGVATAAQPAPAASSAIDSAVRAEVSAATGACGASADSSEIVVCGPARDRYRIDPSVLETMRAREAPPPKPELNATAAASPSMGCVGTQACHGSEIPLVRMALVVARAAALAAAGDDWREAFRTKKDEYQQYRERQERRASDRKVRVEVGAKPQ